MPKIGICKILGNLVFQGRPQYTQITTINMYFLNEVLPYIRIQSHGNYIEVKKINFMLEIDFLLKFLSILGCPEG